MNQFSVSFDDVANAHERLTSVVHRTPVLTSRTANELSGAQLFFKCENFQRTGAFKFRGAYNAISQFTQTQRARGVVAYSGGNHAQGIALAARLLDVDAVIVMPNDAPVSKLAATRGYGAEVVLYDRHTEDREEIGRRLAEDRGLTLIPSYDHAHVIAGQGTAAKELIEEVGPLDILLAPLGGGGLLSGSAVAAKVMNPDCVIIGVEPAAGNDGQLSLRSGAIVHINAPNTIADGAQAQHLGELTFPLIQQFVADILTVNDAELVEAMKFFFNSMKMIVEPTGCLPLAAALSKKPEWRGKRVGLIVSGGNIDLLRFADLIRAG